MTKNNSANRPVPVDLLVVCADVDAPLAEKLRRHLAPLEAQGTIVVLHAGLIRAGSEWHASMRDMIQRASIILVLFSSDLCSSERHGELLDEAMDRHERRAARVVPVLLRPCDYAGTAAGKLRALPRNHVAITSWRDLDEALVDVVGGIQEVIAAVRGGGAAVGEGAVRRKVTPKYPDAKTQALSEELEKARDRRQNLEGAGLDTGPVDQEIRALRRALREGGQLRAGDTLDDGRYLLIDRVGRGGFSVVWKAEDRQRGETVAIKVLHGELAADPLRRERFFRGAHRMVELAGDAVVPILQADGEDGGWFYFVMKFISGGDLRQAVLKKRVPAGDVPRTILQVGSALARAHTRGLVHRDVKPANILLDDEGAAWLTDFDLVFAEDTTGGTRTGALGTFVYAAPEMMERPQDADPRADVYGLGMTAIFGLSGCDLKPSVLRDAEKVIQGLPCNDAVKGVLRRAVEWDKDARFADAGELCEALRSALNPPKPRAALDDAEPLFALEAVMSLKEVEEVGRSILSGRMSEVGEGGGRGPLIAGRYELLRPIPKADHRSGVIGPGTIVGRYEILMPITTARRVSLWAARVNGTRGFEKIVALRTLDLKGIRAHDLLRAFFEDVAVAARVRHPNVMDTYDFGDDRGVLFVAMEWVDGATISELLKLARLSDRVPLRIALRIASQICDGLYAGYVARDGASGDPSEQSARQFELTPHDVVVSTSGIAKLADTGLVHLTRWLDPLHVDGYVSPEEVNGVPADQRSHVFSLGTILYEMLAGLHPFNSFGSEEMSQGNAFASPVPLKDIAPNTPHALSNIIMKALEKVRANRHASILEMKSALDDEAAFLRSVGVWEATDEDVGAFVQRAVGADLGSRTRRLREAIRLMDAEPGR